MATPAHGDVFQNHIEEPLQETSHGALKRDEPEASQSSPDPAKSVSTGGSGSPQRPRSQLIQEVFQAAHAEYENKRYVSCREKCMDLLRDRNLPPTTRCLTLQLFASCSYYYGAKHALEQALILANKLRDLDPDQELRQDVERLLEELEQYRPKDGAPRPYIQEFEYDDLREAE